ncbi:S41 family peptidase [Pseudomonas sp. F1_0610]|uniref:S41 family peptidase n=1 Tax=Pseudomonas sp. F1_0610 TaxID=3114284 RepID=UPI0039C12E4E
MQPISRLSVLALSAALALSASHLALAAPKAEATSQAEKLEQGTVPLDELRTFAEVFERIKNSYVEPIDDKTLLDNAIKGMLDNLDPHSAYLDKNETRDLNEHTQGEFGGLGIEVGTEDGFIKVVSPVDDSPADKAGIKAGDFIVKIDGKPSKSMNLMDAVNSMRGKPGTSIKLTIVRDGGVPFDVEVKRAAIKTQSVKSSLLESGYGLIRISQFQINTGNEVAKAITKLRKENKNQELKGIVLDLRNNPGGVLQAAVEVVDQFIDQGLIVYTKGRMPRSELRFNASGRNANNKMPLVVLINGGSASASEIVAGALQDHKRAVLMGTDSFGKGSVQTVLPLNGERALKITTALYYTPKGRSIQAQGIIPDIIVERAQITNAETNPFAIREADLAGHLGNGNGGEERPSSGKAKAKQSLQEQDYQLAQALNLLKGLNVLK